MMKFTKPHRSYAVGAQFIGTPPIYRPGERIDGHYWPIKKFTKPHRSYAVGAQFIGTPPIYRPGERIDGHYWPINRRCARSIGTYEMTDFGR